MNVTLSSMNVSLSLKEYYIVCSLSGVITTIAIVISIIILLLVWRTKSHLHTVRHLLMCNTYIASIFYCIIQTINYIFLIFVPWKTSDVSCRWRGYFSYLSICAVTYSYLLQAVSRAFICVLSNKYTWLTSFKTHHILILIQWLTVIIVPLPAIVTDDIYSRPASLCRVPMKYFIHVVHTFFAYYIIPTVLICMIYIIIYYRVKKTTNRAETSVRSANSEKRDLELLRNIMILLGIYLIGGLPNILFMITNNESIYLMSIVSISLTMTIEKICMSILDRDIRQIARNLMSTTSRVLPSQQVPSEGNGLGNRNHIQRNRIELRQFYSIQQG